MVVLLKLIRGEARDYLPVGFVYVAGVDGAGQFADVRRPAS